MQKKIVALAVAGISTAAFAQTNVTIYGTVDVSGQGYSMTGGKAQPFSDTTTVAGSTTVGVNTLTATKYNNNAAGKVASGNTFNLQNNSSLIGFKGTEDLGNGLKALFQAETTLNITGGSAAAINNAVLFGAMRDSYVGLNNKYGTALAGYLSTPYRSTLTSFDVLPGATGSGKAEQMMGSMRFSPSNGTGYLQLDSSIRATALAYAMPTLYGFNGSIAYTGSNNNGQNNMETLATPASVSASTAAVKSAMSLNLGWTGYGVNVAGAFQQANTNFNSNAANNDVGNYTSYLIGTSYTGLPGLKASVVYNRNSLGINGTTAYGANKLSNNQLYTGVSYRIGNWEPRLAATWTSSINGAAAPATQTGARQWVLNTGYYLSKRTQVYGLVSNLNDSANQNYFGGQQLSNLKPTGGQNLFTYGLGVRTNF